MERIVATYELSIIVYGFRALNFTFLCWFCQCINTKPCAKNRLIFAHCDYSLLGLISSFLDIIAQLVNQLIQDLLANFVSICGL